MNIAYIHEYGLAEISRKHWRASTQQQNRKGAAIRLTTEISQHCLNIRNDWISIEYLHRSTRELMSIMMMVPRSSVATVVEFVRVIKMVEGRAAPSIRFKPDVDPTSSHRCLVIKGPNSKVNNAKQIIADLVRLSPIEQLLEDFSQLEDVTLPRELATCSFDYYNYVTDLDDPKGYRFNWEDGKMMVEEVNSAPCAVVRAQLSRAVYSCRAFSEYLLATGGGGYMTASGKKLHANETWCLMDGPRSAFRGPCLIAEIIWSRTQPDYIGRKLHSWFTEFPHLSEAIMISIQAGDNSRWAEVYRRSDDTSAGQLYTCAQHVDFGGCKKAGEKFLHLSLVKVFGGESNIPTELKKEYPDNFVPIDLHGVNEGASYGESMERERREWLESQKRSPNDGQEVDQDKSQREEDGNGSN